MKKDLEDELIKLYEEYKKVFNPDMRGIFKFRYLGKLEEIEKYEELKNKKSAYILFLNEKIEYPRGNSKIFSIGYSRNNLYETLIKKKEKIEKATLIKEVNGEYLLKLYGAMVILIENEEELPLNMEYHFVRAFNFFYGRTPRGNYYDSNFKESRLELKLAKI